MKLEDLEKFVRFADSQTPINDYFEKRQWLKTGRSILKDIAKQLNLPNGSYKIFVNEGGAAVSGEITLHGEWIYIQLTQTSHGVLWRFCNGVNDHVGSSNHWFKWPCFSVHGFTAFITCLKTMSDQDPHTKKMIDTLFL